MNDSIAFNFTGVSLRQRLTEIDSNASNESLPGEDYNVKNVVVSMFIIIHVHADAYDVIVAQHILVMLLLFFNLCVLFTSPCSDFNCIFLAGFMCSVELFMCLQMSETVSD